MVEWVGEWGVKRGEGAGGGGRGKRDKQGRKGAGGRGGRGWHQVDTQIIKVVQTNQTKTRERREDKGGHIEEAYVPETICDKRKKGKTPRVAARPHAHTHTSTHTHTHKRVCTRHEETGKRLRKEDPAREAARAPSAAHLVKQGSLRKPTQ